MFKPLLTAEHLKHTNTWAKYFAKGSAEVIHSNYLNGLKQKKQETGLTGFL